MGSTHMRIIIIHNNNKNQIIIMLTTHTLVLRSTNRKISQGWVEKSLYQQSTVTPQIHDCIMFRANVLGASDHHLQRQFSHQYVSLGGTEPRARTSDSAYCRRHHLCDDPNLQHSPSKIEPCAFSVDEALSSPALLSRFADNIIYGAHESD